MKIPHHVKSTLIYPDSVPENAFESWKLTVQKLWLGKGSEWLLKTPVKNFKRVFRLAFSAYVNTSTVFPKPQLEQNHIESIQLA